MSDERDLWTGDDPEQSEDAGLDDVLGMGDLSPDALDDEDYPLLSSDVFESELEALAAYAGDEEAGEETVDEAEVQPAASAGDDEALPEGEVEFPGVDDAMAAEQAAEYAVAERAAEDDDIVSDALELADETGRLRQPRARRFRRMVQNQLGMLPLALLLLALGGYLLAREQDVSGLPDLANDTLAGISVLVVGFAAVFHALLSGRRERGLLFAGLWVLATAGLLTALIYGVDENPDLATWWPLGLWSAGLALVFTYLIERTHDVRLLLLSAIAFVAGVTAYFVSSGRIDSDALHDVAGYWPLLISVAGIGLLPLAFRRRTEQD